MAAPARAEDKFEKPQTVELTEDDRQAQRHKLWVDRLTSLWAPPTVFALLLVCYIVAIELHTPIHLWAQPVLKAIGLGCFAWFVVLAVVRLAYGSFSRARKTRILAREMSDELVDNAKDSRNKLDLKQRQLLMQRARELHLSLRSGDIAGLGAEIKRANETANKILPRRRGSNREFVIGFAKAMAVAVLIRVIFIEPFKIPSGSMLPTLQIGDQIFVNKFIYGVRLPFMNVVPFVLVREPKRGDVIVFNNPVNTSVDYIKRVVGIPGDEIKIVDEVVQVNGVPQPRRLIDEHYAYWNDNFGWVLQHGPLYEEDLSGAKHATLQHKDHPKGGIVEGPYRVPAGHVFVMGDNRDNSTDSRYGLGGPIVAKYVPYGNIKGKAMVVWLSLSHGGLLSELFGGTGLRTDRFFEPVR